MSASDKKKLRKEEHTAKMTERQRQQKAEEKKLKIYTIAFIAAMVLIACIAVFALFMQNATNNGTAERESIAATVGDNEISAAELSFYYKDAINNIYSQFSDGSSSVIDALGLDLSKKLSEQPCLISPDGGSWADYFLSTALDTAQRDYALAAEAKKNNVSLSTASKTDVDNTIANLDAYASFSNYPSGEKYLKAMYGMGATLEGYRAYLERTALANEYYNEYHTNLTIDDAKVQEALEKKDVNEFNTYDYLESYLSYKDFLEGGTEGEDGKKTYTKEEEDAARAKMMEEAKKLAAAKDKDELKKLVEEAAVNESSQLALNEMTNELHSKLEKDLADWLAAEERAEGDIGMIPVVATPAEDDKKEETSEETTEDAETEEKKDEEPIINGCYVVIFQKKNDNTEPLDNVRHILVAYEGGHLDEAKAEKLLKEWKDGAATEDSFIEMVSEHSADEGSIATGGLYENIHHSSSYVEGFRNWAINPDRKVGDTELVESEYGVHIMYYAGNSKMNYREFTVHEELKAEAFDAWYKGVLESMPVLKKDLSKLDLDNLG